MSDDEPRIAGRRLSSPVMMTSCCYPPRVTAPRGPHDRFVHDLEVELDAGQARISGRARDLDVSAVCFTSRESIEPGTKVQVHLRLLLEWGASEAVVVPGLVAWLTPSEGTQQIGVVFGALLPEVHQRLVTLTRVLCGQIALTAPTG